MVIVVVLSKKLATVLLLFLYFPVMKTKIRNKVFSDIVI